MRRSKELNERRATGEAKFEELDMQLATTQEHHAELDEAVIDAERKLAEAREQLRSLERQAQEAQFSSRALAARRGELQRSIETIGSAGGGQRAVRGPTARRADSLDRCRRAGRLADCTRLEARTRSRVGRQAQRITTTSRCVCVAPTKQRLAHEQSLQPLRDRITKLQLEEQAAQLGGAQFLDQLVAAEVDFEALAKTIEDNGVKLYGLQGEIDRIKSRHQRIGCGKSGCARRN